MQEIYLSVVIPCYDEMANLQKGVLDKVVHFLEKKKYIYEIIVVDDGSSDGSVDFVQEFIKENPAVYLLKNHHSGKAGAVTAGMLKARGKFILFTDMDQATPIEEVSKLIPYFEQDYDIVIGSRNSTRKGSPWLRLFISKSMILLRKIIVGIPEITDTQCGFKMFKSSAAENLFTKINELHKGFTSISGSAVTAGFDVELLFLARKLGFRIKEVPVSWLFVETKRVNPFKDSIDALIYLLKIRFNQINGKYKYKNV